MLRDSQKLRIDHIGGRVQFAFVLILLATAWFSIAISQIALGLGLAALLVRWIGGGRAPGRLGLEMSAAALAVWALLTIPFSHDPHLSLVYYKRFYLLTAIWVVASCATDRRRRIWLTVAAAAGALGTSLAQQVPALLAGESLFRVRATGFFNAMTTGLVLMLAALIAVGVLLQAGLRWRWRLAALLVTVSTGLGMAQTVTRSALMGFIGGVGAMLLLKRPRVFAPLLAVTVLAAIVFWGPVTGSLPERLAKRLQPEAMMTAKSPQARLQMWRGGWRMFQANPIVGVGDVGIERFAPDYYGDEKTSYWGHMHSNPVQMAVIWGAPGLLLGTWFLLAPGWILARRWRRPRFVGSGPPADRLATGWLLGAFGAWAGFNLAGLTEWYFGDAESLLLYMALLGCALGAKSGAATPAAPGIEENDGTQE